jgi:hypothetical protein
MPTNGSSQERDLEVMIVVYATIQTSERIIAKQHAERAVQNGLAAAVTEQLQAHMPEGTFVTVMRQNLCEVRPTSQVAPVRQARRRP